MSIFTNTNNPGNLTTAGPGYGNANSILYPGQTGNYTSPNGYTYAVFGSVQDGFNALVNYVQQKLPSYSSAQAFVQHYLGTSTPNSANANPAGYAAIVGQSYGSGDPTAIAQSIATAEGNGKAVAGLTGPSAANTGNTFVNNVLNGGNAVLAGAGSVLSGNTTVNDLGSTIAGLVGNVPAGVSGVAQGAAAVGAGAQAAANAATSLNPLSWIKTGGLVLLGVIVIAIGLFLLASQSKTVQSAAKTGLAAVA